MRLRWDHAGDFGGGLLCATLFLSVILVPVFGPERTALVVLLGPLSYALTSSNPLSVGHVLFALVVVGGPIQLARYALRRDSGRLMFAAGACWALSGPMITGMAAEAAAELRKSAETRSTGGASLFQTEHPGQGFVQAAL